MKKIQIPLTSTSTVPTAYLFLGKGTKLSARYIKEKSQELFMIRAT